MGHNINYTFYCNCFGNNLNRRFQFNQKNLMCSSFNISEQRRAELKNKSFYFDDVGDNISNLNLWLGDLTGLYWVWKNTDDEIVGTNQYRRFWKDEQIKNIKFNKNTLYISQPVVFDVAVSEQYIYWHKDLGLNILYEFVKQKRSSEDMKMIRRLNEINFVSTCNMFFCDRELFNKVCSVLFEIVIEIYHGIKYSLPYIQPQGQTRMLAYLSERILTLLYLEEKRFFGNSVNIETVEFDLITT